MKTKPEHISQDDWDAVDIPELTDEDFAKMKPISHFPELQFLLKAKKTGRPLGSGKKSSTTMRLDNDILEVFKGTGRGWQTRINNALRDWLKEHPPAR